jgi:hypothetical protein
MYIVEHKLLGTPLIIWGLQLLYVALALLLFAVLLKALDKRTSHLHVQIVYVIGMVIINIIWRIAIKKLVPEWF